MAAALPLSGFAGVTAANAAPEDEIVAPADSSVDNCFPAEIIVNSGI
ncbi:MAG: hypothetical protein ACTHV4_07100 [Canibacter sp.]